MQNVLANVFARVVILPILICLALLAKAYRKVFRLNDINKPKLVWAGRAIASLVTTSQAMQSAGYDSVSVASIMYDNIPIDKFDYIIGPKTALPYGLNTLVRMISGSARFIILMFSRDIMHGFFNGGVLSNTPLVDWEYRLWRLAGGKLVLMPYGSDSFVYHQLPNEPWARAIISSYPRTDVEDLKVEQRIEAFTKQADSVVGCIVHDICLPRVDARTVLWYPYDQSLKSKVIPPSDTFRIAHSSNHREIKGTKVLEETVERLQQQGVRVVLEVLEGVSHDEVIKAYSRADIVVDQLLFGYALSALEGLALGKPVISGVTSEPMYQRYLSSKQLQECPIVFCSPQSLEGRLKRLIASPESLNELGMRSRDFAEKYHSAANCSAFFQEIYSTIYAPRD